MKNVALIIGMIMVASLLVAVGWFFGAQQRFFAQLHATTMVDNQITEAVRTSLLLNNLDSGQLDDARHSLRLQLDGNILFIDLLLPDCDERTRALALKVFAHIAQYRSEHPSTYTGKLPAQDATTEAKITSILDRAQKQQHK